MKSLVYSHCKEPNEFWLPIIEKAYAKIHGSYKKLHGGAMTEALVDLTGGVSEKYFFEDPVVSEQVKNGEF